MPERSLSIVLGTPITRQPQLAVQAAGHAQGVLAADGDQGVEAQVRHRLPALLRAALGLEEVGAGAAQDRAAAGQEGAHDVAVERLRVALQQAAPAAVQAHVLVAEPPGAHAHGARG